MASHSHVYPCIGLSWPLTKPPFGSCAIYFHSGVYRYIYIYTTWKLDRWLAASQATSPTPLLGWLLVYHGTKFFSATFWEWLAIYLQVQISPCMSIIYPPKKKNRVKKAKSFPSPPPSKKKQGVTVVTGAAEKNSTTSQYILVGS